ncbi:rhodopsin, GQ-coupled-like [Branchiostoma lanceolatum]|uniref:rhodopsin, GQ-coupled-like n=1 Tax=Branchiostoma lanceolatum TaxID=7740 RepID=UPI0034538C20
MDKMSHSLTNVSLPANRTDQPELSPKDATMQIIFGSMMLVFGLIGVIGNVVALYAFCRNHSVRRPKNYLIANLCLTDLTVCLVYCPIIVTRSLSHGFPSEESCIVEGFVVGVGSVASISSLVAIAVERYLTITKPMKSLTILTQRTLLGAVSAVWAYSLLLAGPPLVGWGRYVREKTDISCTFDYLSTDDATRAHVIMLVIGAFGFPLLIITYCYIRVFTTVRKRAKERNIMSPLKKSESRSEVKSAVTGCIITTSFCLCFCPYAVVASLGLSGFPAPSQAVFAAALLAKVTVLINPVVYVFSIPSFRKALFANAQTKKQTAYTGDGLIVPSPLVRERCTKSAEICRCSDMDNDIQSPIAYSASRETCLVSLAVTERLAERTNSILSLGKEFGLQDTASHQETWV